MAEPVYGSDVSASRGVRTLARMLAALTVLVLVAIPESAVSVPARRSSDPVIETADVDLFYKVYQAAHGNPTAEQLQRDYIDQGSAGLRHLTEIRNVSGKTIAGAIAAHPQIFSNASRCIAVLPRVHKRVAAALGR